MLSRARERKTEAWPWDALRREEAGLEGKHRGLLLSHLLLLSLLPRGRA